MAKKKKKVNLTKKIKQVSKKPLTVDAAFDEMKKANELPLGIRKIPVLQVPVVNLQSGTPGELERRKAIKNVCSHQKELNNISNIQWIEYSNHQILGVCVTCFSRFDTRIPADKALFDAAGQQDRKST